MKKIFAANVGENIFVAIGQYEAAKYDSLLNPPPIRGLYTNDLHTCIAIILCSVDKSKFFLAHLDTNVHTDSLVDYFAWFEQVEYSLHVCKGQMHGLRGGLAAGILSSPEYSVSRFIQRLEQSLLAKNVPKWSAIQIHDSVEGVAGISIGGKIILTEQRGIAVHHQVKKNHAGNMQRYFSKYQGPEMYARMRLYPVYESGHWYEYANTTSDLEYMEYPAILHELGNQLFAQKKHVTAIGYYRQAIEINPKLKEVWFNRGLCLKSLRKFTEAQKAFDQAIAIDPSYMKALWHKSDTFIQQSLPQKALSLIELILRTEPSNESALKLKEKCLLLLQAKERGKACSSFSVSQPGAQQESCQEVLFFQALVSEVRKQILTSHDIISRVACPYYFDNPLVPRALSNFKTRLIEYRRISSEKIAALKQYRLDPNMPPIMSDFSMGSFSHSFVGALVTSSFGMGECSECSARLVVEMLTKNRGNFTFVGINFTKAQPNMEQTHQFIVANLEMSPENKGDNSSIYTFISSLPEDAIIVDPFLGLVFKPNNMPQEFAAYISSYGDSASVIQCFHFKNMGQRFLTHYVSIANKISQELREQNSLPDERSYDLDSKTPVEDTFLISHLKEKTRAAFFGVQNPDYQVDAVVEAHDKNSQMTALSIQDIQGGYGRFFRDKKHGQVFVLEGTNLPERTDRWWALLQNH